MFGVAPPQTLYHTRQASLLTGKQAAAATSAASSTPQSSPTILHKTPPQSPISHALRTLNHSSYSKSRAKKNQRPGTADSAEPLISRLGVEESAPVLQLSDVYLHFRQSLNSLNDIIDRDDKESLVDLHEYLRGNTEPPLQQFTLQEGSSTITSPTHKLERRRSLPVRTSMASLSSEYSAGAGLPTTPTPEESAFQIRRRRAAKLIQFFGVNYRELMNEVLDSLEKGLEEESGKGTLKPDEVQDLLQKLGRLKIKRSQIS